MRIPIEEVQVGDTVNGKQVVNVLHRTSVHYVRITLEGGRETVDGYEGQTTVEVSRHGTHSNH